MAIIYVGTSSAGAADGTSWANRYGTLNAAEDKPVASGDTVYVGPGVYRELLTCDVSGTSAITYIGDVTGEHTDGIGGIVRITGSDNDTTATRANCITATSKNYRTFRGFSFDTTTATLVNIATNCSNCVVEDCTFIGLGAAADSLTIDGTGTTNTVRRCLFLGARQHMLTVTHSADVSTSGHVVENCLFMGTSTGRAVAISNVGGITIRNCTFLATDNAVRVGASLASGQTTTVNNCVVAYCNTAFQAITAPGTNEEITENYNALWGNATDRTNVSTGANSNAYPPLFASPMLLDGLRFPWNPFALSPQSALRAIAGTGMATEDIYGITRPATDSKKSWGAVQFADMSRETTTKRTGSASIKLADAGVHQIFVPTTAVSTTISVYVQWEADYAGTKPSMVVKQPGQSDTTDTATGAASNWEQLSITLTPAASPGYVVVELVSSNTATSGAYDCFWDDLVVA